MGGSLGAGDRNERLRHHVVDIAHQHLGQRRRDRNGKRQHGKNQSLPGPRINDRNQLELEREHLDQQNSQPEHRGGDEQRRDRLDEGAQPRERQQRRERRKGNGQNDGKQKGEGRKPQGRRQIGQKQVAHGNTRLNGI